MGKKEIVRLGARDQFREVYTSDHVADGDREGTIIIFFVATIIMVATLPSWEWFQGLTGISSWVEVLRALFAK